jgi:hypothetical protein
MNYFRDTQSRAENLPQNPRLYLVQERSSLSAER